MMNENRYEICSRAGQPTLEWGVKDNFMEELVAAFKDKQAADDYAHELNTAESEAAWERRISG